MAVYQDLSGRAASVRALFVRGAATIAVVVAAGMLLQRTATGTYEPRFTLNVQADSIGEGLGQGAEVKYHGYTIGSVEVLEPLGSGKQRMTLRLDPPQAESLTADTTAKFIPANSFGTTAVELVSDGTGTRLASGATLHIGKEATSASLTALLRKANQFNRAVSQPGILQALLVFRKHADLVGPLSQAMLDTARLMTILGKNEKLSQSLTVATSVLNGAANVFPLVGRAQGVATSFSETFTPEIAGPGSIQFGYFADLFNELNDGIGRNLDWLTPLVNGVVNILAPASYAMGSIAPEFSRLPSLIDQTGALFKKAQGGQISLNVTLDDMPGLANALQGGQPVAARGPQPAQRQGATADENPEADSDGGDAH